MSYQIDGLQSVDSKTRIGNTSLSSRRKTGNRSNLLAAFSSEQKLRTREITLLSTQSLKLPQTAGSDNEDNAVESAFNYLMLRDLGCSRAEAIRFASPKFANSRNFITNLPPKLRLEYKQSLRKCKYRPGRTFISKDEFEHISQAVRSYIDSHKDHYFALPEEQNKFFELARHKNKVNFEIKQREPETERIGSVFESPKRKNNGRRLTLPRRVVVPDVKSMEKAIKDNNFGSFLSPLAKSKQLSIERRAKDGIKSEAMLGSFLEINSKKINMINANKNNKRNEKSSGCFDLSAHDGTYSSIHENFVNDSVEKMKEQNLSKKSQRYESLIEQSTENVLRKETRIISMRSEEFNILADSKDEEIIEKYNFQKMIEEERKYLDIFRIQKYQLAQKKGDELQMLVEKSQQRKALIEIQERDLKIKKFEIKKEKIQNALLRKKSLIIGKSKQNGKVFNKTDRK